MSPQKAAYWLVSQALMGLVALVALMTDVGGSVGGSELGGKYQLNDRCDWCGSTYNLREFLVQKNGVKTKRYLVTATACAKCADRLTPDDNK